MIQPFKTSNTIEPTTSTWSQMQAQVSTQLLSNTIPILRECVLDELLLELVARLEKSQFESSESTQIFYYTILSLVAYLPDAHSHEPAEGMDDSSDVEDGLGEPLH